MKIRSREFNLYGIFIILIVSIAGIYFNGCCARKTPKKSEKMLPQSLSTHSSISKASKAKANSNVENIGHSAFPWLARNENVDGKPLTNEMKKTVRRPGEEFNRKYADGLRLMEEEQFDKALEIFKEIVQNFPGSEEASFAEYRIAQIYFRNKSNQRALEAYKRIVANYPNSPIAENARAAIVYLETFEKHEKAYVPPEEDDRRRRGY